MIDTRIYKLIDKLIGKEFSHITDLNKLPLIKEKFIKWDNGNLKSSYFLSFLNKEIYKMEDQQ